MKKHFQNSLPLIAVLIFTFSMLNGARSQNGHSSKMDSLDFMVGNWVGLSATYKDGIKQEEIFAHQVIHYELERNILVIKLTSEKLKLHTVINYDATEEAYYYNVFSSNRIGRYKAEYANDTLTVWSSKNRRYIFTRTDNNGFQEYGEMLVNGKWTRYFEDNFTNIQ